MKVAQGSGSCAPGILALVLRLLSSGSMSECRMIVPRVPDWSSSLSAATGAAPSIGSRPMQNRGSTQPATITAHAIVFQSRIAFASSSGVRFFAPRARPSRPPCAVSGTPWELRAREARSAASSFRNRTRIGSPAAVRSWKRDAAVPGDGMSAALGIRSSLRSCRVPPRMRGREHTPAAPAHQAPAVAAVAFVEQRRHQRAVRVVVGPASASSPRRCPTRWCRSCT